MSINSVKPFYMNSKTFADIQTGFQDKKSSESPEPDKYLKAKVVCTTALGVSCALAHIAKKQGFSLSPSAIKNTPIKDWAIFKLFDKKNPDRKLIELEGPEILEIATASVAGGFVGGILFDDKKYKKSKIRESVNQLLGNVAVPIACVWGISELYKRNKTKILSLIPQIKETGKLSKLTNTILKNAPSSIATIFSLTVGIISGNKVSNFLNEKVFHKKVERGIKKTDFAPHVDDVGMSLSLMADKSKFISVIQRAVPLFLCVPGYETGVHRD